jgi:predicted regulator of Ras-like GTPase activity (Roadblock/LC7/MglB family)
MTSDSNRPYVDPQDESASIFYARDIHQLNLVLGKFLQRSGAETVLLVNEAGHLVARQGNSAPASEDTITALVAGSYAASKAMAEMLGADEFSSVVPCGDGRSTMLLRAGDHALLAVTFDDQSSVVLIRTYALEAIRRIYAIFEGHASTGEPDERIQGHRFDSEIDGALSDVFG